ncbi:agamous-like MADS-box protein AGL61 [Andrographis paniculata]|uniref:agamous-like MADS-box protein AGL61 n=1 Tax=Andrographis paniculata TaxID=175694 RepID=UPI0021E74493|nr:agamous-like MADS-box protein AGL61 [Andrographis paniculata]
MAGRQTRGRQRIPIQFIESQDDMYATFSKRRLGLYKKASELSTLCGVDIGLIIFSPTGNPYSFFSPGAEAIMERYRNPDQPVSGIPQFIDDHSRTQLVQLNQALDEVLEMKEQIKDREKQLDEADGIRPKGWWEHVPVESLNANQVLTWTTWFENVRTQIRTRKEELRNGAGTSAAPGSTR